MSSRSLNKALLIGNLTRDPECRYTPSQTLVCSFGVATNREWVNDGGEKQSSVEYHNLVVWSKLAEICKSLLHKGNRVYVEGRLQTRDWQTKDGQQRRTTEIVVENMILLTSKSNSSSSETMMSEEQMGEEQMSAVTEGEIGSEEVVEQKVTEEADDSDIPF
jgi:single-strand DNA-binding protein